MCACGSLPVCEKLDAREGKGKFKGTGKASDKRKGQSEGKGKSEIPDVQNTTLRGQFRRIRGLQLSMTQIQEVLQGVEGLDISQICEQPHKFNCKIERAHRDRKEICDPINRYEIHNGFECNNGKVKNPRPKLIIQGLSGWKDDVLNKVANAFLVHKGNGDSGSYFRRQERQFFIGGITSIIGGIDFASRANMVYMMLSTYHCIRSGSNRESRKVNICTQRGTASEHTYASQHSE